LAHTFSRALPGALITALVEAISVLGPPTPGGALWALGCPAQWDSRQPGGPASASTCREAGVEVPFGRLAGAPAETAVTLVNDWGGGGGGGGDNAATVAEGPGPAPPGVTPTCCLLTLGYGSGGGLLLAGACSPAMVARALRTGAYSGWIPAGPPWQQRQSGLLDAVLQHFRASAGSSPL